METSITGYIGEGSVTLSCEVHGYVTNPVSMIWTKEGSSGELTNSSKYSITFGVGMNELVFLDGDTTLSTVSFLTIMLLSVDDRGNYTCTVDGQQFTTEFFTMDGTAAPTTETVTSAATEATTFPPTIVITQPSPNRCRLTKRIRSHYFVVMYELRESAL